MSLTKQDLKNIESLFINRFDDIEEKFLEIERRDTSHELTFMKMFKRFDNLESMITKAHIRENKNRDRLDKVEMDVDDLRRCIFDYNDGSFKTKASKG